MLKSGGVFLYHEIVLILHSLKGQPWLFQPFFTSLSSLINYMRYFSKKMPQDNNSDNYWLNIHLWSNYNQSYWYLQIHIFTDMAD